MNKDITTVRDTYILRDFHLHFFCYKKDGINYKNVNELTSKIRDLLEELEKETDTLVVETLSDLKTDMKWR